MFKNLFATLVLASLTSLLHAQIQIELETTDVTCHGGSNGKIKIVSSTNGFTFDWADLPGTNDPIERTGLPPGTYTVTANSAAGGTATAEATVSEPAALQADVVLQSVSCFNGANGSIQVLVSGGTPDYTYDWADLPGTNNPPNRTGLPPGTYFVTVTDFWGCSVELWGLGLGVPPPLEASAVTFPASSGQSDGSIDLSVSGGVELYEYLWSGPNGFSATSQDLLNVAAGAYSCVVTDQNGCTTLVTAVVGSTSGTHDAGQWDGPLQLFPNPATEQLTLQVHVPVSECNILVVNTLGQVQTFDNSTTDTYTARWDVAQWPAGVYWLDIRHGQQRTVRQVVVTK